MLSPVTQPMSDRFRCPRVGKEERCSASGATVNRTRMAEAVQTLPFARKKAIIGHQVTNTNETLACVHVSINFSCLVVKFSLLL